LDFRSFFSNNTEITTKKQSSWQKKQSAKKFGGQKFLVGKKYYSPSENLVTFCRLFFNDKVSGFLRNVQRST